MSYDIPQDETNRERFTRLLTGVQRDGTVAKGNGRIGKVLNDIRLLGNLASTQYTYDDKQDDVDKVIDTLMLAVRDLQAQFSKDAPVTTAWTLD